MNKGIKLHCILIVCITHLCFFTSLIGNINAASQKELKDFMHWVTKEVGLSKKDYHFLVKMGYVKSINTVTEEDSVLESLKTKYGMEKKAHAKLLKYIKEHKDEFILKELLAKSAHLKKFAEKYKKQREEEIKRSMQLNSVSSSTTHPYNKKSKRLDDHTKDDVKLDINQEEYINNSNDDIKLDINQEKYIKNSNDDIKLDINQEEYINDHSITESLSEQQKNEINESKNTNDEKGSMIVIKQNQPNQMGDQNEENERSSKEKVLSQTPDSNDASRIVKGQGSLNEVPDENNISDIEEQGKSLNEVLEKSDIEEQGKSLNEVLEKSDISEIVEQKDRFNEVEDKNKTSEVIDVQKELNEIKRGNDFHGVVDKKKNINVVQGQIQDSATLKEERDKRAKRNSLLPLIIALCSVIALTSIGSVICYIKKYRKAKGRNNTSKTKSPKAAV